MNKKSKIINPLIKGGKMTYKRFFFAGCIILALLFTSSLFTQTTTSENALSSIRKGKSVSSTIKGGKHIESKAVFAKDFGARVLGSDNLSSPWVGKHIESDNTLHIFNPPRINIPADDYGVSEDVSAFVRNRTINTNNRTEFSQSVATKTGDLKQPGKGITRKDDLSFTSEGSPPGHPPGGTDALGDILQTIDLAAIGMPGGGFDNAGLSWDGTYLYLQNMFDNNCYVIDPTGPNIVNNFPTGAGAEITWGVGHEQNLWITEAVSLPGMTYEYTFAGAPTGISFNAMQGGAVWMGDASEWWPDGEIWIIAVGGSNKAYKFAVPSGVCLDSLSDPAWASISQRGLTYDPVTATFWIGGWNSNMVWQIDTITGAPIKSFGFTDIASLAYDNQSAGGPYLWLATNAATNYIYKIDPDVSLLNTDAEVLSIDYPNIDCFVMTPGVAVTVQATVRNNGINTETFDVLCEIDSAGTIIYSDIESVTLNSMQSTQVNFAPQWNAPVEDVNYYVTVTTQLAGDEDPSNDSKTTRAKAVTWTDEISYDDGTMANAWRWLEPLSFDSIIAKMCEPPSYPCYLKYAAVYLLSDTDPFWPWPDGTHDPVELTVWVDTDGDNIPDNLVFRDTVCGDAIAPSWVYVVPIDTVQISNYNFWIGFNNLPGGGEEGIGLDAATNFAANKYTGSYGGVWHTQAMQVGDEMIRAYVSTISLDHDVGVSSIDNPPGDAVPPSSNITPQATVTNYGNFTESFDVTLEIDQGGPPIYTNTQFVITLAPGNSTPVTFTNWTTGPEGNTYTMTFYTQLVGDEYPPNDTLSKSVHTYQLGDIIYELDIETPCVDNQLLGVEYDGTYFYVTGGNTGVDPNKVYVIDTLGNLIWTFDQPVWSIGWGWRDLAWDNVYAGADRVDTLYGSADNFADAFGIDLIGGFLTNYASYLGPENPNRALAWMDDNLWFYTANFGSPCYWFDKSNPLIGSVANTWAMYGSAYDTDATDGGWIWWHSQDDPGTGWLGQIEQYDPSTQTFTGLNFGYNPTITIPNVAGGLSFYEGFRNCDVLFALVQGTPDAIVCIFVRQDVTCDHDVGVVSIDAPPVSIMPSTTLDPTATFKNYGIFDETFDVYFDIDTNGALFYTDTRNLTVSSGAESTVAFNSCIFGDIIGFTYDITVYTVLAGDEYSGNDTLTQQTIINPTFWEILDPPQMPNGSSGHSMASGHDGFIYVSGINTGTITNYMYIYDINANTWASGPDAPTASAYGTANYCNGKFYKIGGTSSWPAPLTAIDIYDIAGATWSSGTPSPIGLLDHMSSVFNDSLIFTFGNGNWSMTPTNDVY
ncbi:MAG: hypothetical protein E3J87_08550, partial [Candidatus Cloacimonadota bacterium]